MLGGRSAKETTNNTFGFGLDNEKGLQNNLLSQLIPDLINTIRSQVLAQLNIPNNNNTNTANNNNNNNNNNLDAPQNNNEDHIMDQDSCWSEASIGDDVFGMDDMAYDVPGTQRQQQQPPSPPTPTPGNYPSTVHIQGANNKTMSQENNSNNSNSNNPENSNNNTKSNNHALASHNTVSFSEKQSTSANSKYISQDVQI